MYLQEHASSSGAWDGGLPFHPARHRPTNKAYQRRSAVTRSGLPQDHISYHGTFNFSIQGLEEEKHDENGAELTVQQRSPMRPVSLTHVTLQISNTIQLHEQLHQLPLVADRNTFNVRQPKTAAPFPKHRTKVSPHQNTVTGYFPNFPRHRQIHRPPPSWPEEEETSRVPDQRQERYASSNNGIAPSSKTRHRVLPA